MQAFRRNLTGLQLNGLIVCTVECIKMRCVYLGNNHWQWHCKSCDIALIQWFQQGTCLVILCHPWDWK